MKRTIRTSILTIAGATALFLPSVSSAQSPTLPNGYNVYDMSVGQGFSMGLDLGGGSGVAVLGLSAPTEWSSRSSIAGWLASSWSGGWWSSFLMMDYVSTGLYAYSVMEAINESDEAVGACASILSPARDFCTMSDVFSTSPTITTYSSDSDSLGTDINVHGEATARSLTDAFFFDGNSLHTLPYTQQLFPSEDFGRRYATALNDWSRIVGSMRVNGDRHGLVWEEFTARHSLAEPIASSCYGLSYPMIDINAIVGSLIGTNIEPYDINNANLVVGQQFYGGVHKAFTIDLGACDNHISFIPSPTYSSYIPVLATAVNDSGLVVGEMDSPTSGIDHAFVGIAPSSDFPGGVTFDLNARSIRDGDSDPWRWTFLAAYDIDNDGNIVGIGDYCMDEEEQEDCNASEMRAFLLTPFYLGLAP